MSMRNNFRKASAAPDTIKARIDDVQKDLMNFLENGGVDRVEAEAHWRMKAAALIRQTVVDTFAITDMTPIFTNRVQLELGNTYEWDRLINTLRVVEYSPQSHPLIFTPRKAKYTARTEMFELSYGIPLQKILTRQFQLSDFTDMAAEAILRHKLELVLTAVDTACATGVLDIRGRALRTNAAAADVAKLELDTALRRMHAYNTGVTIFGSRFALSPIFDHGADMAGDPTKEELLRRGVIGWYRGAQLVEVQDKHNIYYDKFTEINGRDWEKLLFISAGQPGADFLDRDLSALQWQLFDTRTAQWSQGVRMDHAVFVHSPYKYHVIQLA